MNYEPKYKEHAEEDKIIFDLTDPRHHVGFTHYGVILADFINSRVQMKPLQQILDERYILEDQSIH